MESECPSCSSTRMAVEDSLTDWEKCSLREEYDPREPVAWLCIRLLGARKEHLHKQADRPWSKGRQEGPRSSGQVAVGLEPLPLPGEKVGWLKVLTDGHEEEASAVPCLCVCEAFTCSTLAGKCWCSS